MRAATGSQAPAAPIPDNSQIARSARLPVSIVPISPARPRISAPPRVAISRASRAPIASAPWRARCISMAWRASGRRLPESLLADPSTPSPTGTPASRIARSGAIPDPSRQLDEGQCAIPVRVRANSAISLASSSTQCACQTWSPTQPSDSAYTPGRQPKASSDQAMSSAFSARWVCSLTPLSAASAAASRISSRETENGEQGAIPTRTIAPSDSSWKASITRMQSSIMSASRSTRLSGGSPPALSPTLIAPRVGWNRSPIVAAASIVSSSRTPSG